MRELAGDGPEARYDRIERLAAIGPIERWKARDRVTQTDVSYEIGGDAGDGDSEGRARIEGDLRQLLRARHPSLAAVIDWGRTAEGRLFVVTEIRQGRSLEEELKGGPWSVDRAKAVIGQIGQAVLEVHKVGVIHRNLGPSSILVDGAGHAKLYDAAIGRVPTGPVAGLGHLAPEQAAGKAVDRRANIYNLAAIFYQLVTGHPPLDGVSPAGLLDERKALSIRRPSARHPAGGLAKEIDATIMKALDRLPSARQPTLRAFLGEVEALPVGVPAALPAASAAPKARPAVLPTAVRPQSSPAPATARASDGPTKTAAPMAIAKPAAATPLPPTLAPSGAAPLSSQREPTPTRSMTVAGFAPLTKLSQPDLAKRIREMSMPAKSSNGATRASPPPVEAAITPTGEGNPPSRTRPTSTSERKPAAVGESKLPVTDWVRPAAASHAETSGSAPGMATTVGAGNAGSLRRSDIAQLLRTAKAEPMGAAPSPSVAEPQSGPALDVPLPAGPGTLNRSGIAELLGAAKARESSVTPCLALPGAEEKSSEVTEPVRPVTAPAAATNEPAAGIGVDAKNESSLEQKKQLIAQMIRDYKTTASAVVAPEPAGEPPATVAPKDSAPVATEPKATSAASQTALANGGSEEGATAAEDPIEAAFGSHRRQQRRRAGVIAVGIGLAIAAKVAVSSMAGPPRAAGGELAARAADPVAQAFVPEAPPGAPPSPRVPDLAPPSGLSLTRARPPAPEGTEGIGHRADIKPSTEPSSAPHARLPSTGATKSAPSGGAVGEVWKQIIAKKSGKNFGEVLRQDGMDPVALPKAPPVLGPKPQPIEAPAPGPPQPR